MQTYNYKISFANIPAIIFMKKAHGVEIVCFSVFEIVA